MMHVEFENFGMETNDNKLVDLNYSGRIEGCIAIRATKNGKEIWNRGKWLIDKYSKR